MEDESNLPRPEIGEWVVDAINWIEDNFTPVLDFFKEDGKEFIDNFAEFLAWVNPYVMLAVFVALALVRSIRFGVFTLVGMLLIQSMEMWEFTMQTLALVLVSAIIAIVLAVPIGILAARNRIVSSAARPVLDFMQTLPPFVYLLPAVALFSTGVVPASIATIIFAMPPGVRLTELGLRQVDAEMVEAGEAFGAAPSKILRGIQLPLATPTIMAGVNQVIMLALSMVVIGGMVGAEGLGQEIYGAITRVQIGPGFEFGIAVVILAIFLDRTTALLGERSPVARAAAKS